MTEQVTDELCQDMPNRRVRQMLRQHLKANESVCNTMLLTKYEEARAIAVRAQQLSLGAEPHIQVPASIHDSLVIAQMELNANCLRLNLRRFSPSCAETDVSVDKLVRADALFSKTPTAALQVTNPANTS
jgi:DNA-directed RNA polymerase subunit K/omega